MKFLKYVLPLLFVATVTVVAAPKVSAISVGDFFDDLRNRINEIPEDKIVADYDSGLHGIPGKFETYEGNDMVIRIGENCKNFFKQFFFGKSDKKGLEGILSEWRISDQNGQCKEGEILIPTPYPSWGDYFEPGRDYCVKNKYFKNLNEMKKEAEEEFGEFDD